MDIDFEKVDPLITIHEYIVRQCEHREAGKHYSIPHFQARISSPGIKEDDTIAGSFSFYGANGEFLGVNTESLWSGDISSTEIFPISFELEMPEGTTRLKCQISFKKSQKNILSYAWETFVVLILILLISLIIKTWI